MARSMAVNLGDDLVAHVVEDDMGIRMEYRGAGGEHLGIVTRIAFKSHPSRPAHRSQIASGTAGVAAWILSVLGAV